MCTKVKQRASAKEIQAKYKATLPPAEAAKFDAPTYNADGYNHPQLVVVQNESGNSVEKMQWGLMPNWNRSDAELEDIANSNLNARAETIFEKASFKDVILKYRCIIPVEGFFEYRDHGKAGKQPFFIYPKELNGFNFGGIYSVRRSQKTNEIIKSFAIVTTEANEMMSKIHNTRMRMPLIISDDNINAWLNKQATKEDLQRLMVPYPTEMMRAHEVSKDLAKLGNVPAAIEEVKKNPDLFGEQGTMDFI